ncbi:MAG: hypothetical protein ABI680_17110 [Chthoniobacteraceae bacterium]
MNSNESFQITPVLDAPPPWWERVLAAKWSYLLIAPLFVGLDFFCGPHIQFPIAFVIPVALAGWFASAGCAYSLAIGLPAVRFGFNFVWTMPWGTDVSLINAAIRIVVLMLIACLIQRTARQTRALVHEVKLLEGILSICGFCKKIRNDRDQWEPLESYVSHSPSADFTRGVCPDCAQRLGARK